MARRFVPEAGDIVWLEFSPQAGHEQAGYEQAGHCPACSPSLLRANRQAGYEQAGHRPVLVLSPAAYNSKTGTMLCCPMTTQIKGYPFEVIVHGKDVSGAALSDQVKNLDWRARKATPKGKASTQELDEVRAKIAALLGMR